MMSYSPCQMRQFYRIFMNLFVTFPERRNARYTESSFAMLQSMCMACICTSRLLPPSKTSKS